MAKIIQIQVEGVRATYEVNHEIDGIYKAKIVNKGFFTNKSFPGELILVRVEDEWKCDCHKKEIGVKIGRQIDEDDNQAFHHA